MVSKFNSKYEPTMKAIEIFFMEIKIFDEIFYEIRDYFWPKIANIDNLLENIHT